MSFFNRNGKIKLTFYADQNIAAWVIPQIEQLIEDSPDGYCRRASNPHSEDGERPVIAMHKGTISSCRIDGPFCGEGKYALGSLILSPGVTAHLNPIETIEIRSRMEAAIEDVILGYIRDNDLQNLKPVSDEIDREIEDPIAISLIETFEIEQKAKKAHDHKRYVLKNVDQPMINQGQIMVIGRGYDATHRTYNIDTHPTHWPAADLSKILSNPFACPLVWRLWIDQNLGFSGPAYRMRICGDL